MMSADPTDDYRVRERECVHRKKGVEGNFYSGEDYVSALKRLGGEGAMRVAGKVGAFFWSDAPHVRVWLCTDCAAEVGLSPPGRS